MTTLSYIKKHAIVGSKNIAAKKTVRTVEEKIVVEKTTEVEEKEDKTKKTTLASMWKRAETDRPAGAGGCVVLRRELMVPEPSCRG